LRGTTWLGMLSGGKLKRVDAWEIIAVANADWPPAFRNMNRWYDRMAAAMRVKDRAERERAIADFERDFAILRERVKTESVATIARAKLGTLDKNLGEAYGDTLIALMLPAAAKVRRAQDRAEQVEHNLHVAFALAAYRAENGRYPQKLDQLA